MIRVLFCGEREVDWLLLQSTLYGPGSIAPRYHLSRAQTLLEARNALLQHTHDLYLIDEAFGDHHAFELLSLLPTSSVTTPAILLMSGAGMSEEMLAIRAGAADVLQRSDLCSRVLYRSIVHVLARAAMAKRTAGIPPGIVSQHLLQQRLDSALAYDRLIHAHVALLAISVEELGVPSTEQFIAAIAERLLSCVRDIDTICHTSAGRFLVLLEGLAHGAQADVLADRFLSELSAPITLQGSEFLLRVSMGIAVAPEDGESSELLLRSAEEALRSAQQAGGQRMRYALGPLNEKAQRRLQLRQALEGALERGEFSLHYQPQVELRDECVSGVEALLRWRSERLGPVSPAEFVPLLEAMNLIESVGTWVLREACKQAQRWVLQGIRIKVGVNVSARQLSPEFGYLCERILRETGLSPGQLGLEITEGLLLENAPHTLELLKKLQALGVSISIDDFGTGYASLSYVKRFPMDVIKIDKEFVRGIPLDVENVAITSAILALGNSLGLKVIAEGVEHDSELELLRSLGCTAIQGYFYARPMPPAEFEAWLRARA